MQELIRQFYNEGLATTFYLKPLAFVSKYVKNEFLLYFFKVIILILYTFGVTLFATYVFLSKLL